MPVVPSRIRYVEHFTERGCDFYRIACEYDLEGIVGKWKHGAYGTDPLKTSWVKVKNPDYSQAVDRHELFEKRRARAGSAKRRKLELTLV